MADRAPILVFIHIPKTAGTTLTSLIAASYPGDRARAVANVFGGGGGVKRGATFRHLHKDEGAILERAGMLHGHLPLGSREQLPGDREFRFFTFLRDPVERTLSHYFNVLSAAGRRRGTKQARLSPEATLEEAIAGGHIFGDLQTRMLCGVPEPFGEADDSMLERAKHNLGEELFCFGLTERFDESLLLMRGRLGLRSVVYRSGDRINAERPRGADVPEELAAAARGCNRLDIELYRHAVELFDRAPELREPDFAVELAALRAANAGAPTEAPRRPDGFEGDDSAWEALVAERAAALRSEHELAEIAVSLAELNVGVGRVLARVEILAEALRGGPEGPSRAGGRSRVRS